MSSPGKEDILREHARRSRSRSRSRLADLSSASDHTSGSLHSRGSLHSARARARARSRSSSLVDPLQLLASRRDSHSHSHANHPTARYFSNSSLESSSSEEEEEEDDDNSDNSFFQDEPVAFEIVPDVFINSNSNVLSETSSHSASRPNRSLSPLPPQETLREHARSSGSRSPSRIADASDENDLTSASLHSARSCRKRRPSHRTSLSQTNIFEFSLEDSSSQSSEQQHCQPDIVEDSDRSLGDFLDEEEKGEIQPTQTPSNHPNSSRPSFGQSSSSFFAGTSWNPQNFFLRQLQHEEEEQDTATPVSPQISNNASHTASFGTGSSTNFLGGTSWNPQSFYLNHMQEEEEEHDTFNAAELSFQRASTTAAAAAPHQQRPTMESILHTFQNRMNSSFSSLTSPSQSQPPPPEPNFSAERYFAPPEAFMVDQSVNLMDSAYDHHSSSRGRGYGGGAKETTETNKTWAFWRRRRRPLKRTTTKNHKRRRRRNTSFEMDNRRRRNRSFDMDNDRRRVPVSPSSSSSSTFRPSSFFCFIRDKTSSQNRARRNNHNNNNQQNQRSSRRMSLCSTHSSASSLASICFQDSSHRGGQNVHRQGSNQKRWLVLAIVMVVGLAVVMALALFGVTVRIRAQKSQASSHNNNPLIKELVRKDAIVSALLRLNITSTRAFRDANSGAFQALQWLLEEDPLQLSVAAQDHHEQVLIPRFALATLYFSTQGFAAGWSRRDKWLTRASVCDWYGVQCYHQSSSSGASALLVTRLNLTSNHLDGTLPLELKALHHLIAIDLSHNSLSGPILEDLTGAWRNLLSLRFHGNQLIGSLPAQISGKLKEIVLYQNHITGTLPAQMMQLNQLEVLYMQENLLTGVDWTSVDWTSLKYLHLHNNRLQGSIGSGGIRKMTKLVELSLSDNDLTGVVPAAIWIPSNLEMLRLGSNDMAGAIPESIGDLGQLTDLQLNNNRFRSALPAAFGSLSNLKWLAIDNSGMTGSIPVTWGGMTNLEVLLAHRNDLVGKLASTVFGRLRKLRRVSLHTNLLMGALPTALGNLMQLEELLLQSNSFRGTLVSELGKLSKLSKLDLTQNHLSGSVPSAICDLRTGRGRDGGKLKALTMDCKSDALDCPCCTRCT